MEFHKIWIEQCEAARGIEDEFGVQKALDYLIGDKFLNFLEVAETDADFRAEIPAFVAKIKAIFERWQLAEYLETARETEPFDPELENEITGYLNEALRKGLNHELVTLGPIFNRFLARESFQAILNSTSSVELAPGRPSLPHPNGRVSVHPVSN